LSELKSEIDKVKSDITVGTSNNSISLQSLKVAKKPTFNSLPPAVGKITPDEVKIRTIIHDIHRRKSNVVICGLPEPVVADENEKREADRITVINMFEEHLDVKPSLSHLGCVRLGKLETHNHKPRKLLVHLSSEVAATSILKSASLLRRSDDPVIASSIFVNPDFCPADAKIAYEKRQRKRERRNGEGASHSSIQDSIQDSTQDRANNEMNLAAQTASTVVAAATADMPRSSSSTLVTPTTSGTSVTLAEASWNKQPFQ